MAGLTQNGFEIRRLPDVIAALQSDAQQVFADIAPAGDEIDVGPNSTIGRLIGLVSPAYAGLWEGLQYVYDSFNPNASTGISLDNLVALSGITRKPAAATTASVLLRGDNNVNINLSSKVSSITTKRVFSFTAPVMLNQYQASGIGISVNAVLNSTTYQVSYSTDGTLFTDIAITSDASATSDEILAALKTQFDTTTGGAFTTYYQDGYLFITRTDPFQIVSFEVSTNITINKILKLGLVACDEIGPLPQLANSITTIATPVLGWDSVTNPEEATLGRYKETDEELRERFRNSKFMQSANIIESLLDGLRNVDGVTDVVVYENDGDVTDAYGVPAKSFMPIVLGGSNTAVAQTIWTNKPTGILSHGNTAVTIYDSQNRPHQINFMRPASIPIYVSVDVSSTGSLAGDAVAKIKQAVYENLVANYSIGDDIIYSRLYTPVNSVPGHQVNSLTLGTAPTPVGTSNIVIDFDEVGTFSLDYITVTVT